MNASEFKAAFKIADDETVTNLYIENTTHLFGFALRDFKPTVATLRQVAEVMRWQALYAIRTKYDSKWDMEALNEVRDAFRKKVTIIGSDK